MATLHRAETRLLHSEDLRAVERLLYSSDYIYQRFTVEELPLMLKRYPAIGEFREATLHSFLLSQSVNPPTAWIGGFGVSSTHSQSYSDMLASQLSVLVHRLRRRNVRYLHYSGNQMERDWLYPLLKEQNFVPYRYLYSYDKFDFRVPTTGNQQVTVRPVNLPRVKRTGDLAALLEIEELCFEELWRYDALAFADIVATHPYFVVAEQQGRVIGYQFNAIEAEAGYLIRIAVHPAYAGKGVGARLMAEAIRFFDEAHVSRIMLNTQEDNTHAHRLYEWFGFIRLDQKGFVLRKEL